MTPCDEKKPGNGEALPDEALDAVGGGEFFGEHVDELRVLPDPKPEVYPADTPKEYLLNGFSDPQPPL